jgi:large subunit ribosomal protein L6
LLNSVTGVTEGFSKTLEIVGTGYKAELNGNDKLKLTLGFSHIVNFDLPQGITAKIEDRGTLLTIEGINKQVVGETAANIRKIRKPDAYKGKGVRYKGEELRLKPGKAGAKK